VFIASSVDNYIATEDDSLDWLNAASRSDEDYGYQSFMSSVDCVAMGRRTWDSIEAIDPLPFADRRVYVFTHRPPTSARPEITFWDASPSQALDEWSRLGVEHVYIDGGQLISSFLAEGLVDDLVLTKIPVLLGSGRPLFTRVEKTTSLTLESVEAFPSGIVNLRYSRS
jgi:dihydrofolate reductase